MRKIILLFLLIVSPILQAEDESKVKVEGKFKIEYFLEQLSFEIVGENPRLGLKITHLGEGDEKSCIYKVTRISSPQQSRGLDGVIFARMVETNICDFQIKDKKLQEVLNKIRLIHIDYRIGQDIEVYGNIELRTRHKTYLSKF